MKRKRHEVSLSRPFHSCTLRSSFVSSSLRPPPLRVERSEWSGTEGDTTPGEARPGGMEEDRENDRNDKMNEGYDGY